VAEDQQKTKLRHSFRNCRNISTKKDARVNKNSFLKYIFGNAFISPFNTQTMHIKLFYTQKHAYVYLKTWRDSNPGLLVPAADAMSTALRRQGMVIPSVYLKKNNNLFSFFIVFT
jgi:hypothetical protein